MKFRLATAENLLVFLEIIRLSHHGRDVINRSATFALIVRCHTASTTSIIIRHKSHFLELVPELKKLQHSLNGNLYQQIYLYSKFETPNNSKYCCYSHWHAQYSCKWLTLHVYYSDNIANVQQYDYRTSKSMNTSSKLSSSLKLSYELSKK